MANINASALNSLQTRINNERSRRSLSPITFTDGTHGAGDTIKATHFNELRSGTEGLNTLGSQSFNWSGNIAVGASITDVTTQISNFVTTLENESLAGWKTVNISAKVHVASNLHAVWNIPTAAHAVGKVRWKTAYSDHTVLAHATLNRSINFTPASTGIQYGGGYNFFNMNQHKGTASTGFGLPAVNGSYIQPWTGSYGDQFNNVIGLPTQTPFADNDNKGGLANTGSAEAFNGGAGQIAQGLAGTGYSCATNHWYYSVEPFTSTFNSVFLHCWTGSRDITTSDLVIEAYY